MTHYVDTYPTARKPHRCNACGRTIRPGEEYWRQAGLDGNRAWTNVTCAHCGACAVTYCRTIYEDEWDRLDMLEWLAGERPVEWSGLLAGWRFPDGELMPPPFEQRCVDCGTLIPRRHLWCDPCDERRIARVGAQLLEIAARVAS